MVKSRLMFLFFCYLGMIHAQDLPPPYNSLTTLRPFVDHGWYQNASQLRELIERHHIKVIVEIGAWLGQSTMDLARHIPEDGVVYAVDHWLGSAEHQVGNSAWHPCLPYLYEQFLSNVIHAKLTHKIIPIRMTSLEAASYLKVHPDMVYIDAGHGTEEVYCDLCTWFPFVQGSGILCGDDWLWGTVRDAVHRFAQENSLTVSALGNFWVLIE